jgi:sterol desaturase/sphingolipid hydroxylase (fatty acid hydroxylase superfamily)
MSEDQLAELIKQWRYIISFLVLVAMWILESVVPMYRVFVKNLRRRFAHAAANLGISLLNAALVFGFSFAIIFATQFSSINSLGLLYRVELPVWLHWLLALVLFDLWQYWWHRMNHEVSFLWRFHAVHHADAEMDVTSGIRFHTVEILFSMITRLLVLPVIGVTVPQLLLYEVLALPVILFHHSNVRIPYAVDSSLRWLIVTPWMHWVHHSRWQPETDSNYSSFLSIWDRLFGSFRLRKNPEEICMGLDGWEEGDWFRLTGMLTAPFRRRGSMDGSSLAE